ncbi:hypothetical protein [Desulfosarcina cetonica]|uniref:hypothetical protein n=1 Tax=Desulfosarcina cetonica TaxID=90730 RepID=UPI0012EE5974|nr:hypothetical protein [Desulfosarcina cetonica]
MPPSTKGQALGSVAGVAGVAVAAPLNLFFRVPLEKHILLFLLYILTFSLFLNLSDCASLATDLFLAVLLFATATVATPATGPYLMRDSRIIWTPP